MTFCKIFGFRKGYSTEQAILEITDTLKKAMDKKMVTCGLFLDFSKAFDTVDHGILLSGTAQGEGLGGLKPLPPPTLLCFIKLK